MTTEERNALVVAHMHLVGKVARQMRRRFPPHIQEDDLMQVGAIGLISAVERFNPENGANLQTFAEVRIRGAMKDYLRDRDVLHRGARELLSEIRAAARAAEMSIGGPAGPEDVAREMGISLDKFYAKEKKIAGEEIGFDDIEEAFLDRSADPAGSDPMAMLARKELASQLSDAISTLPVRLQYAVSLYYGRDLSLIEIGEIMGVGGSRICQMLNEALKKLREPIAALDLDGHQSK